MNITTIIQKLSILLVFWLFFFACSKDVVEPPDEDAVEVIQPEVIATFPHDPAAFTQGLLWHDGVFFESTGRYGQSSLRKVAIVSGEVQLRHDLDSRFFGEGLALKNDRLVQLTWLENTALVYDMTNFAPVDTFPYPTQGWGLTNDDTHFIMSDGSDQIYFRDDNFELVKTIFVTRDGEPVNQLNELEFVNGLIYANVWQTEIIVGIDPQSGDVRRVIDCSGLVAAENPQGSGAVLNGIAYNPQTDTFYLTGKLWKTVFEVRLESTAF